MNQTKIDFLPVLATAIFLILHPLPLHSESFKMVKVQSFEELSNTDISEDWGKKTLTDAYFDRLKHSETEHFIFHYERSPSKIARRAEDIYREIMDFLGNPEDKMKTQKSHIFVIPDYPRWKKWRVAVAGNSWMGGVCRGNEFYFPAEDYSGKFDTKGKTLNHEMTHLVLNRIFPEQHIPTWLNEGVAEYFGSRVNMSTTKFRGRMGAKKADWTLDELSKYEHGYGTLTNKALSSFYAEAAIFVDFLTDQQDPKLLVKFIQATADGDSLQTAVTEVYPYKSYEKFKEDYEAYRDKF